MKLAVFQGFSQDIVLDLTGLSASRLRSYRESGIVKPKKAEQSFQYSFQDVLTLKLIKQLILRDVKPMYIKNASRYFDDIDPSKSLLHYKLYFRDDTKEIIYFGDEPGQMINASQFGQLILDGVALILPIGEELEKVRVHIIDFDQSIRRGLKQKKLIPFREALKQHGLG